MSNYAIYRRTLCFSFRKLLFDLIMLVMIAGCCVGGFFIAEKTYDKGLIGLGIGLLAGCIVAGLIAHFFAYMYKAAQIAMMARAVTDGELPDNVYKEGRKVVKERFLTVFAYFAATRIIKAIFNQLGHAISSLGRAIGGDTGQGIGSAISAVIQVIISYLCDCCLGWVFVRRDQNAMRATLEGAVLFFKHGKTFIKNMGRVFGIGLLSLGAIGGGFFGVFYFISTFLRSYVELLGKEIVEAGVRLELNLPAWVSDTTMLSLLICGILAVTVWSFIHNSFVRPFILTGVLRNYINSGVNDIPTEDAFKALDGKSSKFAKLHAKLKA